MKNNSLQYKVAEIIVRLEKDHTQQEICEIAKRIPRSRQGLLWFKTKSYPELYKEAKIKYEN